MAEQASESAERLGKSLEKLKKMPKISAEEMVNAEAEKAIQSRIGAAAGAMQNLATPGIYMQNAMASEMSQAQSAFKAMMTKGGVMAAVDTDVAAAEIGAKEMQSALKGKLKAFGAKGNTLEDQADSIIEKAGKVAERQSFVQTASTLQDMSMKDRHGGYEKIALKSAAIQSAGQIADVKGFESNYGGSKAGVESFIGDSTQQSRKKYASTRGAARAIRGWSNAALAENAEFSEQASIESAQAQIREGGGNAKAAAHKLARKAAADMRGLVDTQNVFDKMRGAGGYEEAAAYMAQKSATDSLKMLSADVESGLAEMKMVSVGKGKNKREEARFSVSREGGEAMLQGQRDKATASRTQRDAAFDPKMARAMDEVYQGLATADQQTLINSGMAEMVRGADGKMQIRATVGHDRSRALSQQKAGNLFGLHGATLADGSTLKVFVGKNAQTGEYTARVADYDKETREKIGHSVGIDPTGQATYEAMYAAKNVGTAALQTRGQNPAEASENAVGSAEGALTLGATAFGGYLFNKALSTPTPVKKDGKYQDKSGTPVIKDKEGNYQVEVDSKGVNKQEDGTFADEKGNKVTQGEDGKFYKPIDDSKIKTKSMGPVGKSWNWMGSAGQTMKESVESFKTKKTSEKTSNPSDDNSGDKQDKPSGDNATQGTPPKQNSTGSNPSSTDNFTTGSDPKQPLSNADHARNELKLMAAERIAGLEGKDDAKSVAQRTALKSVLKSIGNGNEIDTKELAAGGIHEGDLNKAGFVRDTKQDAKGNKSATIDFEDSGAEQKSRAERTMNKAAALQEAKAQQPDTKQQSSSRSAPFEGKGREELEEFKERNQKAVREPSSLRGALRCLGLAPCSAGRRLRRQKCL